MGPRLSTAARTECGGACEHSEGILRSQEESGYNQRARDRPGACVSSEGGAMIIGVPKEVKDHEFRVSLTPDGVQALCAAGHCVWVEPTEGEGRGVWGEVCRKAGALLA